MGSIVTFKDLCRLVASGESSRLELKRSTGELQGLVGLQDRMHFQRSYLEALVAKGWLEMTVPDKPKSRLQRYRATAAGLAQVQRGARPSRPARSP
jgi:hypothetical protein